MSILEPGENSGRGEVSTIAHALGRLAMFASLAGLVIGARRSGRQETNRGAPARAGQPEEKSGWDKAAVIVQAVGGLAIFVSLAGVLVGVWQFNTQQKTNAADQVDQRHQTTLDNYLNDMSDLVLNHNLTTAGPNSPITAIAIARTATAVRYIDGSSKGILIRFLWEAGLILRPKPTLDLYQVDLAGAVFQNANLYRVYLSPLSLLGANFNDTQLEGAYLSKDILIQADLKNADLACWTPGVCTDLAGAYLMRADLAGANLTGADLADADLDGANLTGASLAGANLHGAVYNARAASVLNVQGKLVINMPTSWPKGFSPQAAGATCDDCPRGNEAT